MDYQFQVSIVIVCMNNLKNLYTCLNSIEKYTFISYEVIVIAYLFSKENLEKLKNEYSWIKIIKSDEIRGFSENNNLALKVAKGKYCFIMNDDTFIKSSVVDLLVSDIKQLDDKTAIVSPNILFPDGTSQFCGRDRLSVSDFIFGKYNLFSRINKSKYVNQKGLFKTYNIVGAAFLIKTDIFRTIGFFDERYFFCPEDIAVSTKLNKMGYECYVDSNIHIYHKGGGSGLSKLIGATKPAGDKGTLIFFEENTKVPNSLIALSILCIKFLFYAFWLIKFFFCKKEKFKCMSRANLNVCCSIFSNLTPKQIFEKYYNTRVW